MSKSLLWRGFFAVLEATALVFLNTNAGPGVQGKRAFDLSLLHCNDGCLLGKPRRSCCGFLWSCCWVGWRVHTRRRSTRSVRHQLAGRGRARRLLSGARRRHLPPLRARRDHRAGRPEVNNRILLPVGKLDFFMSANSLQSLRCGRAEHSDHRGRRHVPEGPAGADGASGPGVEKFEDLKKLTLFVSKEGHRQLLPVAQGRLRLQRSEGEALHVQPAAVPRRQVERMQGYVTSEPYAVEKQAGFQAEGLPARRPRLRQLLDPDRDRAATWSRSKPDLVQRFVDASDRSAGTTISTATTRPATR